MLRKMARVEKAMSASTWTDAPQEGLLPAGEDVGPADGSTSSPATRAARACGVAPCVTWASSPATQAAAFT